MNPDHSGPFGVEGGMDHTFRWIFSYIFSGIISVSLSSQWVCLVSIGNFTFRYIVFESGIATVCFIIGTLGNAIKLAVSNGNQLQDAI